jgi:hypothetical protein
MYTLKNVKILYIYYVHEINLQSQQLNLNPPWLKEFMKDSYDCNENI